MTQTTLFWARENKISEILLKIYKKFSMSYLLILLKSLRFNHLTEL